MTNDKRTPDTRYGSQGDPHAGSYSCVDGSFVAKRKKTTEMSVHSIPQEDGEWAIVRGPVHGFGECEPFARHSGTSAEIWIDASGELRVDAPRSMPGSVRIPMWVLDELFEHERQRKMQSTRPPPPFTLESV